MRHEAETAKEEESQNIFELSKRLNMISKTANIHIGEHVMSKKGPPQGSHTMPSIALEKKCVQITKVDDRWPLMGKFGQSKVQ